MYIYVYIIILTINKKKVFSLPFSKSGQKDIKGDSQIVK